MGRLVSAERECATCECEYIQRGGDPELSMTECMACELERLRAELEQAGFDLALAQVAADLLARELEARAK